MTDSIHQQAINQQLSRILRIYSEQGAIKTHDALQSATSLSNYEMQDSIVNEVLLDLRSILHTELGEN